MSVAEIDKQTGKKRKATKFQHGNPGGPGRPRGSKNKATILKEMLIQAVTDAAKEAGYKTAETYLASVCSADVMNFLRVVGPLLPKEHKVDVNERVVLHFGDDDACSNQDSNG